MKNVNVALIFGLLVSIVGGIVDAKNKGPVMPRKGKIAMNLDTYDSLLAKYEEQVKEYNALDMQRAILESGCATQDQLAEVESKIAGIRSAAQNTYDMLSEMPQFGAYKGPHVPEAASVCKVTKNLQAQIDKLKEENKKLKAKLKAATSNKKK